MTWEYGNRTGFLGSLAKRLKVRSMEKQMPVGHALTFVFQGLGFRRQDKTR